MKKQILVAEFLSTPWALMPERLTAFASVISCWQSGAPRAMDDDDGPSKPKGFEAARQKAQAQVGDGYIAVLPLYGVVVQRANMATDFCGGTSCQQFTAAFREAVADPRVSGILIDIDSPGGSVYGVSELGAEIFSARDKKKIVAVANSLAASAAYWVGCAASEFYVTPGGEVGSIGVWQAHEDWSKALDEQGVKTTLISSGKYKTEGNYYEPLGDDSKAFMQSRTDDYYNAFVAAVAQGRGVSVDQVRNGMGQGRVLGADAALQENMVDGIATFDDVVRKMQKDLPQRNANASAKRRAERERKLQILGC